LKLKTIIFLFSSKLNYLAIKAGNRLFNILVPNKFKKERHRSINTNTFLSSYFFRPCCPCPYVCWYRDVLAICPGPRDSKTETAAWFWFNSETRRLRDSETPTPNSKLRLFSCVTCFRFLLEWELGLPFSIWQQLSKNETWKRTDLGGPKDWALRSKVKVAICLFCFVSFCLAFFGQVSPVPGCFLTFWGPQKSLWFRPVNRRRGEEDDC